MKTVAAMWADFESRALPDTIMPELRLNDRLIFYAGVQSAIIEVLTTIKESNGNADICATKLNSMCVECITHLLTADVDNNGKLARTV